MNEAMVQVYLARLLNISPSVKCEVIEVICTVPVKEKKPVKRARPAANLANFGASLVDYVL